MSIESLKNISSSDLNVGKKEGKDILRERRILLKLTQQKVADKAGIGIRQYQKFESGERSILTCSFVIACKVIKALEMDITEFYNMTM